MKTLVFSSVIAALQASTALAAGGPGRVPASADLNTPEAIAVMAEKKAEAIRTTIAAPTVQPGLSGVADAAYVAPVQPLAPPPAGGKTKS